MPWGWIAVIVIVVAIVYIRLRKPTINVPAGTSPDEYMLRATKRMDRVEQVTDKTAERTKRNGLSDVYLQETATELRKLAEQQRREVVPLPAMETHKQDYFRVIDLEARKIEDLLATGGANLESILADEAYLGEEIEAEKVDSQQKVKEITTALGMPMSDFTKDDRN